MTRVLLMASAVVVSVAWSAPRKPALIGSAKEDDCPAVVPAAPALPPRDVAYLRAVAFAFEPAPQEVRAQAIEDLGLLGDPRALNLLAVLTLDPNPRLSQAAIRAVGLLRHPRAEEILGNLMRHPSAPMANRVFALSLLPYQNTVTALRTVHFATGQGLPPEVLQEARALAAVLRRPTDAEVPGPTAPAGETK